MFRAITESAATDLEVARVSIWRLLDDGSAIRCEDLYLREEGRHVHGTELMARDFPEYFGALLEERAIDAHDAVRDPRTRVLRKEYLEPLGITSMLDVPVWHSQRLYGVLCHEHTGPSRRWHNEEVDFAGNLADFVSLALEAHDRRAAEERWKAAAESIADLLIVFDRHGEIILANPPARELLEKRGGMERTRTLAQRFQLLEITDTSDRVLPLDAWPGPRMLRGEEVRGEVVGIRGLPAGERRFFRITATPLRDSDGVSGSVCVFVDVTEEVHFERLKRDFLSALAHELKTPVAISKGYAQLLARAEDFPPARRPMLAAVTRAADRMDRLIGSMVDVSNIILGGLALTRAPADLAEIVQRVAQRAQRGSSRHSFIIRAPAPVAVMIDVARVEQALRHLLDNAVRFSPAGGQVDIDVSVREGAALVSIQDRGIGIPRSRQQHLFELFYRAHADTPNDFGGLGLGLFLSRSIALQHGGELWFESEESQGSTFYVRLPLAEAP
jgi:signal transduction histidine kinase